MTRAVVFKRRFTGNTLAEYVLIGALVCVGCIAVFMQISQNFGDQISGLKTEMQQHAHKAAQAQQQAQGMQAIQAMLKGAGTQAGMGGIHSSQSTVFTAGSNGGKLNADTISDGSIGSVSVADLNPAQQDAFRNLANQAHKIAQMEELIESAAVASGGNAQKFHDARFALNGNNAYSVYYLSKIMYSQELKNFDTMKLKLLQTGGLPMNALTYLNSLVNDVQVRASSVDMLTHANDTSGISTLNASTDTHRDGKQICTTGQHQDQGKHCE